MAVLCAVWEMSQVSSIDLKTISRDLRERLLEIQPDGMKVNRWCELAKVNGSFFTDLRKGSEPGIDKVDRLVAVAGLTLSEFLSGHTHPRIDIPSVDELTQLLEGVQRELPANLPFSAWPRSAAAALHTRLEQLARARGNRDASDQVVHVEGVPPRLPTKPTAEA